MRGARQCRRTRCQIFVAAVVWIVSALGPLASAPSAGANEPVIEIEGLQFTAEEGGLVLKSGRGSGTREDPFVLEEDIVDAGAVVLSVRGMSRDFGNRIGTPHEIGFMLTKIVTNKTPHVWRAFEVELREIRTRRSPFQDGLSFGQLEGPVRQLASDDFASAYVQDEPYDALIYGDGDVPPGETVTVRLMVTDFSPNYQFYIIQRGDVPLALRDG